VVVLKATGQAIYEALENSVSSYPALEGRFPQVSNIIFAFDPSLAPNSRIDIKTIQIGSTPLEPEKVYTLVTRGYMGRGKDGYTSLLVEPEGGKCPEIVSEENGVLISTILRQYFMSLKVLGKWKMLGPAFSKHWDSVQKDLHEKQSVLEPEPLKHKDVKNVRKKHLRSSQTPPASDSEDDEGAALKVGTVEQEALDEDKKSIIMRRVMKKWWRLAGLKGRPGLADTEEFNTVHWTKAITPRLEGRIIMVGG
jgi:5'-nucleotidase